MLPKELNLFGTTFRIIYDPGINSEDDGTCGETDVVERTIRIHPDLSPAVEIETFYHELAHVVMDHMGISSLLSSDEEEVFAQGFGVALTYLVSANTLPALPGKEGESK
jgi:hypothetical protein